MKKFLFEVAIVLLASAWSLKGQSTSKPDPTEIRNFELHAVRIDNEATEILTAVRLMLPPDTKLYLDFSRKILIVRGTPVVLDEAGKLISELDKPKKAYRITYTVNESDGGKRIGTQHFSLTTSAGQRSVLKQGSKVPIVTGSYDQGKAGSQTQFTYLDIGLNFDATPEDLDGAVSLKSKVEQSSIAPEPSTFVTDPIVRQSILENCSLVTLGKPLTLGSLDVPGSTRHLDIEVVVEPQK